MGRRPLSHRSMVARTAARAMVGTAAPFGAGCSGGGHSSSTSVARCGGFKGATGVNSGRSSSGGASRSSFSSTRTSLQPDGGALGFNGGGGAAPFSSTGGGGASTSGFGCHGGGTDGSGASRFSPSGGALDGTGGSGASGPLGETARPGETAPVPGPPEEATSVPAPPHGSAVSSAPSSGPQLLSAPAPGPWANRPGCDATWPLQRRNRRRLRGHRKKQLRFQTPPQGSAVSSAPSSGPQLLSASAPRPRAAHLAGWAGTRYPFHRRKRRRSRGHREKQRRFRASPQGSDRVRTCHPVHEEVHKEEEEEEPYQRSYRPSGRSGAAIGTPGAGRSTS